MLYNAIVFSIIAVVVGVFGFSSATGILAIIAQALFVVLLGLLLIPVLASLAREIWRKDAWSPRRRTPR